MILSKSTTTTATPATTYSTVTKKLLQLQLQQQQQQQQQNKENGHSQAIRNTKKINIRTTKMRVKMKISIGIIMNIMLIVTKVMKGNIVVGKKAAEKPRINQ